MPGDTYSGPSIDILRNLPPELYKTIPFAQPPPGVIAQFENPPTRVPVILGVSITYLTIATFCLSLRVHARISITKNWKWDDTLVVFGFMFSIAYFSSLVIGCLGGAAGRHEWDVHLDKALGHASLIQSYMCTIMANPALGLIKMSLLLQYFHLFNIKRYVRISVYVVGTLTAVFYVSISIIAFVMNGPWPGESLLDVILSSHYLKFAKFSIPGGVIGMLVDWTLFVLPIPAVLSLHISYKKKIGVMLIFLTGGLGATSSVISLYYRVGLQNNPSDTTWKVGYVLLWTQIEMWSGITASCMPSVKQVFSFYTPRASHESTLDHSNSRFRRPKRQQVPDPECSFKRWGYRSNLDAEREEERERSSAESSSKLTSVRSASNAAKGSEFITMHELTPHGILPSNNVDISQKSPRNL